MVSEMRLGDLLLQQGLVTETELARALERQRLQSQRETLGQILVEQKIVTPRQLEAVLDGHGKRQRLGSVLLRQGVITPQQLEQALMMQKRSRSSLGRTLIKLGFLDEAGLRQALARQLDIPYIDLDRVSLDRSLSKVVNATYARRHNIVPVAM